MMAVQDDAREREMRQLFNLVRDPEAGRGGVDALMEHDTEGFVPFELKSATGGKASISTVRDFGLHHVEKWRELHWLFGIYDRDASGDMALQYCLYGPPSKMAAWFDKMALYIAPDVALARQLPDTVDESILTDVFGDAEEFALDDAKRLMKKQFSREQYGSWADLPGGKYSRDAMLKMLRLRARYVILRGSTLNNPHIPPSYFTGWEQITKNHALRLRELVAAELA